VNAATDCTSTLCHQTYYNAINEKQHFGSDQCTYCHDSSYRTHNGVYLGYKVNETTCNQNICHSNTSLSALRPVAESHGNHYYGQNKADCIQCHFANTTKIFPLSSPSNPYYSHDHNFTVEYNFYNYNISGIPLSTNNGVGKGMFPYYTCTLTCHSGAYKIEDEVIAWSQSGHAQIPNSWVNWTNRTATKAPYVGVGCLTCKSPTQFNPSIQIQVAKSDWQGIQCRVCHNLHNDTYSGNGTPPISIAFYNGTSSYSLGRPSYDKVVNDTELCEKCHQGYHNKINYTGSHKTSLGFTCASCHMNSTINNGATHTFNVNNTATGKTGCEACHQAKDHTFKYTSKHTGKATCEACHDKTVARNASGYAMSSDRKNGLYNDSTGVISSFKDDHGVLTWPLNHNISKDVSCDKCHGTKSAVTNLKLAPGGGPTGICAGCHPSYDTALNNSKHNGTLNGGAPDCMDCHTGYDTNFVGSNHTTRTIVNRTTCIKCHVEGVWAASISVIRLRPR
jgi:hypothetical protein